MSASPDHVVRGADRVPAGTGAVTGRRARRRLETIEEIIGTAVAVMAEAGAGGLSLGEVARRMGLGTPSLYQYFPSKNAIYDEVFARGWRELEAHMRAFDRAAGPVDSLEAARALLREGAIAFVRWALDHPVHAQLMFWRPVPGFTPSPAAYAPAVSLLELTRSTLARLVDAGWLRPEAASEEAVRAQTVLITGVISQQLSNQPATGYDDGLFTPLVPLLTGMFFDTYAGTDQPDTAKEQP